MAIIAVTNLKGGTGKSTTTMQLAGTLGLRGFRVLVVDADAKQGSASSWAGNAPDDRPFPATVTGVVGDGAKVYRELKALSADYDFVIVDCPPTRESLINGSILKAADLALVPVIPSPVDVIATGGTEVLIEEAQAMNPGLRGYFLINQATDTTNLARQMMAVLSSFKLPSLKSRLRMRIAYRESCADGGTVFHLGSRGKGALDEINALTDEVLGLLHEKAAA